MIDMDTSPVYRTLSVKFTDDYAGERQIHFMEHKTSTPCAEKPLGRTLYVTCIPPWATAESLERVFAEAGPVQKFFLEKRPNPGPTPESERIGNNNNDISRFLFPLPETRVGFGFKVAYVVYKTASAMRAALTSLDVSKPRILSTPEAPIVTGLLKWKREYNGSILPDEEVDGLKEAIKNFTDTFDREKEAVVRQAEEEAEPDEDGWVTVSRHTSKKPVGGLSEKSQARMKAKAEKKRKKKELENFYKFQMRDTKLKRLDELKTKFEADKQRQIKMKQDRKFKPF